MNGLISYNGHYVKEASRATCFFRSVKFDIMRVEPGTVVRGDAFLPELATGMRNSFSPTGTMLLEKLKPLTIVTFETDSGRIHQVAENQLTEDIKRLLHLAGFSEDIYCSTNYGRFPHAF
jgi:hypothetical protein